MHHNLCNQPETCAHPSHAGLEVTEYEPKRPAGPYQNPPEFERSIVKMMEQERAAGYAQGFDEGAQPAFHALVAGFCLGAGIAAVGAALIVHGRHWFGL
jgi:hypothetical protein